MRIIKKAQQIEIWDFLMDYQNIMFDYTPVSEKLEKSKNGNQLILMNVNNDVFNKPLSTEGIQFIYSKYWELSWAIKMKYCIFEKN